MRDDPFIIDTPRKTLDMAGQPIEFPILYYDCRWITAIFTARTSKLKKYFLITILSLYRCGPEGAC